MRLLVVEDDASLADGLCRALRQSGHAVDAVTSGEHALFALENEVFDVVILDLGLPGIDGLEVLRRLRREDWHVPVIVLTARDTVADRVRGLDLGADDYLVKPFAFEELEARIRVVSRRARPALGPSFTQGALVIDFAAREARTDAERIDLTGREWALLELFLMNRGVALSKSRIIQSLSSWDANLTPNAIEVYVSRLRNKLEPHGLRVRTVRGFGYLLEQGGEEPHAP